MTAFAAVQYEVGFSSNIAEKVEEVMTFLAAVPPAPVEHEIGDIWREGGRFYERTYADDRADLPFVTTYIEREDRCELLRFGVRLLPGGRLDMPMLTADGADVEEIAEARLTCFDENRHDIRLTLKMDDVEFQNAVRSFR